MTKRLPLIPERTTEDLGRQADAEIKSSMEIQHHLLASVWQKGYSAGLAAAVQNAERDRRTWRARARKERGK